MCAYETKRLQEPNKDFLKKKLRRLNSLGWRAITPITASFMVDANDSTNTCIIYWVDITNQSHNNLEESCYLGTDQTHGSF